MYTRIKELRKALGISQSEFAKRLGMSQSTWAMIEVGRRRFNDKHIRLVCSEFHVSEAWLRTGKGEMFLASCLDEDFIAIFENLRPEAQEFLIKMARELLVMQQKLSGSEDVKKDPS